MPIPNPGKKESQGSYVARCMKFFKNENSKLPRKQQLAACYKNYSKANRKKAKANDKKPRNLAQELRKLANLYHNKYHM